MVGHQNQDGLDLRGCYTEGVSSSSTVVGDPAKDFRKLRLFIDLSEYAERVANKRDRLHGRGYLQRVGLPLMRHMN